MKNAIASVEIYAHRAGLATSASAPASVRRLTLVISAPERAESGTDWACRVALADLERPRTLFAADSVSVLLAAISQGRAWLAGLEEDGWALFRDREGREGFDLGVSLDLAKDDRPLT